jgi:hypothetical protein
LDRPASSSLLETDIEIVLESTRVLSGIGGHSDTEKSMPASFLQLLIHNADETKESIHQVLIELSEYIPE